LASSRIENINRKNENNKFKLQNEDKFIAFEDNLTKDVYRENAYLKALNYDNIRKSLKTYENSRKEVKDYYKMNDKLIKDFIYSDSH